jgi:uncharacterized Zn finger protein
LARGRTYARAGRTHDLEVKKGKAHALVTGSRATPYVVSIELKALDKETWQRLITGMAAKAQFAAQLLAGEMPKDLDQVFRAAGSSLFPVDRADLVTSCTCPDWGDPCKHVAATHYVLGEALDRDPFLLFELRGRSKEQVLEALRSARAPAEPTKPGKLASRSSKSKAAPRGPKVAAATAKPRALPVPAADYDKPRTALPSLSFSFEGPSAPGALLRQLGAPAAWPGATSPADALAPLVRAAAQRAREIALAAPPAESPTRPARFPKK